MLPSWRCRSAPERCRRRCGSSAWTPDRNAEFLPCNETEAADRTGGRLPGFKPYPDDTPEPSFLRSLDVVIAGWEQQLRSKDA